jgi:hypothetical protein
MSFRGKRRSVNTRPGRKAGVMTASRWSATHPAHSVRREVRSDDSRLDESSAGCPSTSCSPAELASVSPAVAILLNLKQAVQRKIAARPPVSRLVSHARGQAQTVMEAIVMRDELRMLLEPHKPPCLSLYLPTHRRHPSQSWHLRNEMNNEMKINN